MRYEPTNRLSDFFASSGNPYVTRPDIWKTPITREEIEWTADRWLCSQIRRLVRADEIKSNAVDQAIKGFHGSNNTCEYCGEPLGSNPYCDKCLPEDDD